MTTTILAKQTIVLPTKETIYKLKQIFDCCSFSINWNTLHVELNLSPAYSNNEDEHTNRQLEINSDKVFEAVAVNSYDTDLGRGLVTAYNPVTESSSLYLPLTSPELLEYAMVLREQDGTMFHSVPLLYLTLCPFYANSLRHNRFCNSVSDALVARPLVLTFDAMFQRQIEVVPGLAPDQGYYELNGLK